MAAELDVMLDGSPERLLDLKAPGLGSVTEKIEEIETDISSLKDGINQKADAIVNSASGSIASFTDGADGLQIKQATFGIEPKQDLHGYEHPWIGGTGKNLLPLIDNNRTVSGITIATQKDSDGNIISYTVNGTATANVFLDVAKRNISLSATGYTLTGCPSGGGFANKYVLILYQSGTAKISDNGAGGTQTLEEGSTYYCQIRIASGCTVSNLIFKPMLRLATETDSTFEPYENICPISGYTGMTVQRTGKNRCTPGEFGTVSESSPAGRPYKRVQNGSTTRMRSKNLIPVVVGQSFTVSFNSADYYVAFMGFDSNGLYLGRGSSWREFQTASPTSASWANVAYIAIVLRKADNSTMTLTDWYNAQIQVDIGNTATDFEPYTGQTIPITFPGSAGTVYGGNVVINEDGSGVLTVDRKMVEFTGSTSGSISWGGFVTTVSDEGVIDDSRSDLLICSHAKSVSDNYFYSTRNTTDAPNVAAKGTNKQLRFRHLGIEKTVESYQTFFAQEQTNGTPVTVVYLLATPTTYNLTSEQISTLLGVNNLWCDTGDTSVEYRADTKLYIDGLIGTTDDDYTANQNIASGQFFSIGNHLYRATSAIASGATIVPGTNCVETNIAEQLTALYASLN